MAESQGSTASAEAGWKGTNVASAGSLLVVDVGKKQAKKRIRALRKGEGKLFAKITDLVDELKSSGTVKGDVQPIVIVVREKPRRMFAW